MGQDNKSAIVKVSYITLPTSEKMVSLLKEQIKDPQAYNNSLQQMSEYKIYHSLYINAQSNQTVYIIDSVKKVEHVHVAGYLSNVFKNEKNIFSAEGLFLNSTYNFQGNSSELNWVIDGEEKVINGYACKKATLSNSPDVTVWFTTAIPVNSGPEFYYGLPGLVIEADSYFEKCEASKITYDVKVSDFDTLVKKETIALENKKQISLKEAVLSKQNFIQMIEKQSAEKNNN